MDTHAKLLLAVMDYERSEEKKRPNIYRLGHLLNGGSVPNTWAPTPTTHQSHLENNMLEFIGAVAVSAALFTDV